MDLTARVSRALRAIDGAIVVVDAVEGCQIQTEIVTKQALQECIKPILYINKVDRLIKELKLNSHEIEKHFENIIDKFNDYIEIYAEDEFKDKWKIIPEKNNVGFGCALNPSWGFTVNTMLNKRLKFENILNYYKNGMEKIRTLSGILPLDKCILDMIINHLPSPKIAQRYRIKKIWKGNLNSYVARNMQACNENGPFIICIHKILFDKHVGRISIGRIFSGTINSGDEVYLLNAKENNRIQQIFISMGHKRENVNSLTAGNIGAFIGLSKATVGETLTQIEFKDEIDPFENIKYVSEPVITVSIEPKHPKELPKMLDILNKIEVNDPDIKININEDTGEYLISGIGQLHLEIIANEMKNLGIDILMSDPIIVYREGIKQRSPLISIKSQNNLNLIQISLEPINEDQIKEILKHRKILAIDYNNNLIINNLKQDYLDDKIKQIIIKGIKMALNAGPLCEEPIKGLQININSLKIDKKTLEVDPLQIMLMGKRAIYNAFLKAEPTIFEPIYKIQIQVPMDLIGIITALLLQRKGKILDVEQKSSYSFITGLIPVKESFNLASDIRSKTAGQAFWQTIFSHWEFIPYDSAQKIISDIRVKKGRKAEIPKADFFNNN
ncbi:MAG: elongation factor EF-2 [Candidatus Helarchaeota archaeon]|nr:elongation factor EF-2 [Candidatus Helarchaeota archaeon]